MASYTNIILIVLVALNSIFTNILYGHQRYGKSDLITIFNRHDKLINNGDGYKNWLNDNGYLAWRESYIMLAYTVMYNASKDIYYLKKLIDHADVVLSNRDDAIGLLDYRGITSAGWRSKKYTSTVDSTYYYSFIVHSGMITFPIIRFVDIVHRDSTLLVLMTTDGITFLEKANNYLKKVEETIAYHDDQWINGPGETEGYYVYRSDAEFLKYSKYIDPGKHLPFNQQNALGRVLILLYKLTGKDKYYDKALRLANFFKSRLKILDDNSYVWNYWMDINNAVYKGRGEDISHASINVSFAVLAFHNSIVFDNINMQRFVNTFTKRIAQSDGNLFDWVSGDYYESDYKPPKSFPRNNFLTQSGRWLDLTEFDRSVYTTVEGIYHRQNYYGREGVGQLIGIANLILWFED